MKKLYRMSEAELLSHINTYRVNWDVESDVEDYVDECEEVISWLECLMDDDEADKAVLEYDIEEVTALRDEAQERLDEMYSDDDQYMEHEYWSMVM